ncbi:MAG: translocation/assembly module TamB domain-containing protein, partial [Flavobacteriaceae bacterium]|nr:translocation/assembly module TamB domain-containing protein [Flavobacteriaceae bacterium]
MVLLFILLMLIISIPAVQTKIGKFATKKVNDEFGTNINISKVGLQINGDVELKDVLIVDYKNDTLFHVNELNTSIISFKKLYHGKLTFGDIDVIGLTFNLKTYKGEKDTNLDVFVERFESDSTSTSKSKFLLSSSDISLIDSKFRLIDLNLEKTDVLSIDDINVNATNFLIFGPDVSARFNKLSFHESRHLYVQNLKTNFTYTLNAMTFEALEVETKNSHLKGDLKFEYDREHLQKFVDSVQITAKFEDSKVSFEDVNMLYNEFGTNQSAMLNTEIHGTLNNFITKDLQLETQSKTKIEGTINFKNLFSKTDGDFMIDAKLKNLSSNYNELNRLMPNLLGKNIPSIVDSLGTFNITGNTVITSKSALANLDIATQSGYIITNLELQNIDDIENASYKGNIVLDQFNVGTLINDKSVGEVSLNLDVDGSGFNLDNVDTNVNGNIYSLVYKDYNYENVVISGNVQEKIFSGQLIAKDNNLDFKFNGLANFTEGEEQYDFTADVKHADLHELNFIRKDSISQFEGLVTMDIKGTSLEDFYGNLSFKNTFYKNEYTEYFFDDFEVTSRFDNDLRFITINSPDIIEGNLSGKFRFRDILKLVENSLGDIYTNYKPHELLDDQFIDYNFKIYNKIVEVFYQDLKIAPNTTINGHIESDAKQFKLNFESPEIHYAENIASNVNFVFDNKNQLFNTFIDIDKLDTKFYDAAEFSLINVTKNDTLFVRTEFKGGSLNEDLYNLNLYYTINEENKSVIGLKKSEINLKQNEWIINEDENDENKVVFDRSFKNVSIEKFKMTHEDELMELYGSATDSTFKDIELDFINVDLEKITPDLDSLDLAGNVNGKLNIYQRRGVHIPQSDVTIENFKINDFNLGDFKAIIVGNENLTNYTVNVTLADETNQSLSVDGNIDLNSYNPTIDLEVDFRKFILNPLNPFGEGVVTNIRGEVNGRAKVSGQLSKPDITGQLSIDDAGLKIPYLNIDYAFEDGTIVDLVDQTFNFKDARLTDDEFFSRGILNGYIKHSNFSNWLLDLNIESDRLLVLNTDEKEDEAYYGTAFVGGIIGIKGPTNALVIKAEVESKEGTIFKIPLNDSENFGNSSYIHFLSREEKDARKMGIPIANDDVSGLEMDFDLVLNENAEIEIVIDKESESSIRGRGAGTLLTKINTKGKFEMIGSFVVYEGIYNFVYGGLIFKEFKVIPGGTIEWSGDPLAANLNIEAVYDNIRANPSVLLDNPVNQS